MSSGHLPAASPPTPAQVDAVAADAHEIRRIRTAAQPANPPGIPPEYPDPQGLVTGDCVQP